MKNFFYSLTALIIFTPLCFGQNSHSGVVPAYTSKTVINGGLTDSTDLIISNKGKAKLAFCMNSSSSTPCNGGIVLQQGETVTKKVIDLGGVSNGDKLNVTNSTDGSGSYSISSGPDSQPGPGPNPGPGPVLPGPNSCFVNSNSNSGKIKGPTWTSLDNVDYGIVYTGTPCPGRVGIGTSTPAEILDVNGNALFRGNVGIGKTNPVSKLDVNGTATISQDLNLGWNLSNGGGNIILGKLDGQDQGTKLLNRAIAHLSNDRLALNLDGDFEGGTYIAGPKLLIDGTVGVGTGSHNLGSFKMAVEGKLGAQEMIVTLQNDPWPDYVFEKKYQLLSIDELKKYLEKNMHLPNIPSATEVKMQEGVNLGEMQQKLLEKIEEQSLYIIQLNERLNALEKQNTELKKSNK